MAPKKIRYQSRSVETHVDARDAVWQRIVAVIRNGPARPGTVVRAAVAFCLRGRHRRLGLDFWQSTVLIRDDGPTCHIAWGLVFDPEPSEAAVDESVEILARMQASLDAIAAELA